MKLYEEKLDSSPDEVPKKHKISKKVNTEITPK